MERLFRYVAATIIMAAAAFPLSARVKYVFYIIGDGLTINAATATGIFNTGRSDTPLNFCDFPVRTMISTYAANRLVTDSAAAGTALACGIKTNNRCEGMAPDGTPVESVVVKAGKAGYGSAVISTCEIASAPPAAFLFHNMSRNNPDQMTSSLPSVEGVDFIGCHNIFMRERSRTAAVRDSIRRAGYTMFCGKGSFHTVPGKAIFLADTTTAECALAIDRKPDMVSLADLVRAGLDQMTSKYMKKGFIMAIEAGEIDHMGHSNDAVTQFVEINDMAKTVDMALDFYRKHSSQTLIVVTSDHETGGFVFDTRRGTDIQKLHCQKMSMMAITRSLQKMRLEHPDAGWDEVKAFLTDALGLWSVQSVSEKEEARLKEMCDAFFRGEEKTVKDLYHINLQIANEAVNYLCRKNGVKWGTYGHTGADVGLYAIGAGSEQFADCKDNTDVPKTILNILKLTDRRRK